MADDNQDLSQSPMSGSGVTQNTATLGTPGLSLIGVDAPSRRQAQYQTPTPTEITSEQLVQPTSNESVLNQGSQAILTAGKEEEQGAQGRLQATLQGTQAQQGAISSAHQAAIDEMKSVVSQSKASNDNFQQLLGLGVKFWEGRQQTKANQELYQAVQEVEQFKSEQASHGLFEHGIAPARQQLQAILAKYKNIPTKELESLLKEGYTPINSFAERQQGLLFENQKQLKAAAGQQVSLQYQIKASQLLTALGNIGNPDMAGTLNGIQGVIQQITNDPNVDNLTKQQTIVDLYKQAQANISTHDQEGMKGVQHLADGLNYLQEEAQINQGIRDGTYSPEVGQRMLEASRLKNRQITTVTPTGYDYNTKKGLEYQQQQQEQQKLDQANITTGIDKVKFSSAQMGVLVWEAANNPDVYSNWKNSPGVKDSGLAKSIVQYADEWKKGQQFLATQGVAVAKAKEGLTRYQSQTTEELIKLAAKASPQQLQELSQGDQVLLGLLRSAQQRPYTPQELEEINASRTRVMQGQADVIRAYDQQAQQYTSQFAPLGLQGSRQEIETNQLKNKDLVKSTHDAFIQAQQAGVVPPTGQNYYSQGGYKAPNAPFDQPQAGAYGQMNRPASFATATYLGKTTILPFPRDAQASVLANYRQDRGNHTHAGVDLPVPVGTKTQAVVNGRVTRVEDHGNEGYGKLIDVLGTDGMTYRYAHLSAQQVHVGQNVSPGQTLGLSGNTGHTDGPHLHFEVRNNGGWGFDGTVDPLAYLQGHSPNASNTFKPRGNTDHQYQGNSFVSNQQYFPANALPLPGGYLLNGKFYQKNDNTAPSGQMPYSQSSPIRNGYMSNNVKDYPPNNGQDNFGYSLLAKDGDWRNSLHNTATKLGIPAVWLADVMATESSHDHTVINAGGCVGLIQLCPGSQMGYSPEHIATMSRAAQTSGPVYAYLKDGLRSIGKINSPAELQLLIFGGAGRVLEMRKQGSSYNISDSNISRRDYMIKLGGGKRRYAP